MLTHVNENEKYSKKKKKKNKKGTCPQNMALIHVVVPVISNGRTWTDAAQSRFKKRPSGIVTEHLTINYIRTIRLMCNDMF